MKKIFTLALALFGSVALYAQTKEALAVIHNFAPQAKVKLSLTGKVDGCDLFETQVVGGVLQIKGSSGTALCRGFYDFVKRNNYGINSWSGNRSALPKKLTDAPLRRVVSPFAHHFYFNVVTYGYTMPYWDWARWSQEIDYMALHGIDMPLALVANEAISARVFRKLGLSEEQIAAYFVGPAHLPWMRMGNISKIDGPLPRGWHEAQIALQHKILKKMRGLGMKPICPAFAGFVPQEIGELYPEAQVVETHWGGAFNNYMVSPKSELFGRIGTMFIQEWEREFGKNGHYLADSFNEMEVPFPAVGTAERYDLLADYGDILYQSIRAANPDAVWVMQGWMFGYQRNIWEPQTLEALCSKVPDDKMLLLDEAVDYNKHFWGNGYNWDFYGGFFNKPWVYGSIPNMGGKTGLTGVLEFYANGHLAALNSPNKGRLVGYGMAPEGIENNEVIYELITDAGWSSDSIDLKQWLANYSTQRYGHQRAAVDSAWCYLIRSVYGSFTDHPRYNWQFRPRLVRKGTINASEEFYRAIEHFASADLNQSALYGVDLIEFTAAYAGGKAEILAQAIENAYTMGETEKAAALQERFVQLLSAIDRLLESHPTHRLARWIERARKYGKSHKQSDYYEKNARRIVTIWGPPVDDYSARIWSGLIRDYYLPRWQAYFAAKSQGKPLDQEQMAAWERNWVEQTTGLSPCQPYADPLCAARELLRGAKDISVELMPNVIGNWGAGNATAEHRFVIPASVLRKIKALRFNRLNGQGELKLIALALEADGKRFDQNIAPTGSISLRRSSVVVPFSIDLSATANNSCVLLLRAEGDDIAGNIELVF